MWPRRPISDSMLGMNHVCLPVCYLVMSMWTVPWTYPMGVQIVRDMVLILTPNRQFIPLIDVSLSLSKDWGAAGDGELHHQG